MKVVTRFHLYMADADISQAKISSVKYSLRGQTIIYVPSVGYIGILQRYLYSY